MWQEQGVYCYVLNIYDGLYGIGIASNFDKDSIFILNLIIIPSNAHTEK